MDPNIQPAIPTSGNPTTPPADTPPPPPSPVEPNIPMDTPVLSPPPAETPPPTPPLPPQPEPPPSTEAPTPSSLQAENYPPIPPPPPAIDTNMSNPNGSSSGKFYQSKKFLGASALILLAIVSTGLILSQTQKEESVTNTQSQTTTPAPPTQPLTLSLESPIDETLVTNGEVIIKGKTSPNTTVIFFTDSADGSAESDASGNFQGTLSLAEGINTVTITAYSESGEEKSVTLDIVYDSEGTGT